MSTKYRKKPVVIEAVQYRAEMSVSGNLPEGVRIVYWEDGPQGPGPHPTICTLEGRMIVMDGDWVITGIRGERYPCRPDIFEATYEPVEYASPAPGTRYKVGIDPARPDLEGSPLSVGDTVFVRGESDEEYTVKALGVLCEPEGVGATITDSAGGERTVPYEGLSRECPKVAALDQGLEGNDNPLAHDDLPTDQDGNQVPPL